MFELPFPYLQEAATSVFGRRRFFGRFVGAFMATLSCAGAMLCAASASPLQLPDTPPVAGYTTTDAFPGLGFGPVCMTVPPGETNRLFLVRRGGYIYVITNLMNPNVTLFLDLSTRAYFYGEGGILGLAFHPGYRTNRYFYVDYTLQTTTAAGTGFHDRVARFETSPDDPNVGLIDSEVPLITQFDEDADHNAGDLHFGPDGYLYVSLGDEGGSGGQFDNSQRIDKDFFSGILRLDVDKRPGSLAPNAHPAASAHYAVPPDNPFIGTTNFNGISVDPNMVRTEFWAVGFRNPWRMSFDPVTGDLYCGDVGQSGREEVNVVVKGGNYGWNYREGTIAYDPVPPPSMPSPTVDPVLEYRRIGSTVDPGLEGNCVIGGVVYRGSRLPELNGHYVFGDHASANVWAMRYDGANATAFRQLLNLNGPSQLICFGVDPSNGDVLLGLQGVNEVRRLIYSTNISGTMLPPTLADTGAFKNLVDLVPGDGLMPYEINVPFWSDHARKSRWFSLPVGNPRMRFDVSGNWSFPTGMVWVKHFELEMTNGIPESARRLETRFLVRNANGVYGITYRWNESQTNAVLVPEEGANESFLVHDGGTVRTQSWRYPGRIECLVCHTDKGGWALGFNTAQLNRTDDYGNGLTNQIVALSGLGYFDGPTPAPETLPRLASAEDKTVSLEHRVRSYLHANCAQCHQPGGAGQGLWDARIATPLEEAGLMEGPLLNNEGNELNRVVRPGSLENSILFRRVARLGPGHMPPLATSELDEQSIDLLTQWIRNSVSSLTVSWTMSGQLHLACSGEPGRAYRIEASDNLTQWRTVATVIATAMGTVDYVEDARSGEVFRFYRVVWP